MRWNPPGCSLSVRRMDVSAADCVACTSLLGSLLALELCVCVCVIERVVGCVSMSAL